jgi:hypothetical protein
VVVALRRRAHVVGGRDRHAGQARQGVDHVLVRIAPDLIGGQHAGRADRLDLLIGVRLALAVDDDRRDVAIQIRGLSHGGQGRQQQDSGGATGHPPAPPMRQVIGVWGLGAAEDRSGHGVTRSGAAPQRVRLSALSFRGWTRQFCDISD